MLLINNQTTNEHAANSRIHIQLDSLNGVKDIIASNEFSNDEKIHLIQSQFIVENAEMKQLDQEIKDLASIEAFFGGHLEDRCTTCDGSCEQDVPEGQMTIFEFIAAEPVQDQKPTSVAKAENPFAPVPEPPNGLSNELPSELSKELVHAINSMQELANTVLAAFEK